MHAGPWTLLSVPRMPLGQGALQQPYRSVLCGGPRTHQAVGYLTPGQSLAPMMLARQVHTRKPKLLALKGCAQGQTTRMQRTFNSHPGAFVPEPALLPDVDLASTCA